MANKGVLITIIVVLALVVLGLIFYFVALPLFNLGQPAYGNTGAGQATNQPAAPDFTGNITAATFQDYPAGTKITQGMIGTITNIFHAGDQIGINGTSNVNKQVTLTIKVFDLNGNDMGIIWHGSTITIQSGTFGFGVISVPNTPGNYTLKIYLDNYDSYVMPFQVV